MTIDIKRIAAHKTPQALRDRLNDLSLKFPIDDNIQKAPHSPLAKPITIGSHTLSNRWAIHPMEGWDATTDGKPTPSLIRRWERFGQSGAKLLWGMEAIAIRPDGRANPNQLIINKENIKPIIDAAHTALNAHQQNFGTTSDLLWGLQLTHSGRFCRPTDKKRMEPQIVYPHPILNRKFGLPLDYPVLTDDDVRRLIDDFITAAEIAAGAGVPFIDIKQCHGYLLHEFLSAHTRPGQFGGPALEQRTEVARQIIKGIKQVAPNITIGVRLSAFDFVPYTPDQTRATGGNLGPGIPENYDNYLPYNYGFGINRQAPTTFDIREPVQYLKMLKEWGVAIVNITCGSPYYNPHIQRPAIFPPSDGYQPAEDPIINVARQIEAVRQLKFSVPEMPLVSSGLTYLQEYLPHTAQALIANGWTDIIGIGRMVLSYPRLPADTLEKGELTPRLICRTFSDCTTAPRNGLISGCFPLDDYYKATPEAEALKAIKQKQKEELKNQQNQPN